MAVFPTSTAERKHAGVERKHPQILINGDRAARKAITPSFGMCAVFPWQPGGDPVITGHCLTRLLILGSVAGAVASTSNFTS